MPLYAADLGVTGLTVEVTEIADDKTTAVAATTTGVTELGTTGIYYRQWTLDPTAALLYWQKQSDATVFAIGPATERDIDQVTTAVGTDGTNLTEAGGTGDQLTTLATAASVSALNDISAADVNAQVVDVLRTDTSTLPGQEAPTATPTLEEALMYLYKALRNKSTQTATEFKLFADDGSTVDQKSTVSDDGTTATKGELGTGP